MTSKRNRKFFFERVNLHLFDGKLPAKGQKIGVDLFKNPDMALEVKKMPSRSCCSHGRGHLHRQEIRRRFDPKTED